ncbi:MAG TPA: uridine kinase [Bacillota bacterium]|nr:uridine kinase [Bacillota bacterium]
MKKPTFVGIAGGSASGKTTLANLLFEKLPFLRVKVLHADQYYKKVLPKTTAPFTGIVYDDYNQPDSLYLDRMYQDLCSAASEDWHVVIAEGLFILQDNRIRGLLDIKIYVDCRSDERAVRRLRRNMAKGLDFDEVANVMMDSVRYRHDEFVESSRWYADLVVNGSAMPQRGVDAILAWIQQQYRMIQ